MDIKKPLLVKVEAFIYAFVYSCVGSSATPSAYKRFRYLSFIKRRQESRRPTTAACIYFFRVGCDGGRRGRP